MAEEPYWSDGQPWLDPVLRDAADGDSGAVRTVLAMASPFALRYCRARFGGRGLSRLSAGVARDACLAILEALPSHHGGSLLRLVYTVASAKVTDALRALTDHSVMDAADPGRRLALLLDKLPVAQQEILILRVAVGLSVDETAEAVGMPQKSVRVTQYRAMTRLRAMIGSE